jgi:hypothetical protein
MKTHDSFSTTGGGFSRQCCEFQMQHDQAFAILSTGGGGPLDAPQHMAAGAFNATEWRSGGHLIPHQTVFERGTT